MSNSPATDTTVEDTGKNKSHRFIRRNGAFFFCTRYIHTQPAHRHTCISANETVDFSGWSFGQSDNQVGPSGSVDDIAAGSDANKETIVAAGVLPGWVPLQEELPRNQGRPVVPADPWCPVHVGRRRAYL